MLEVSINFKDLQILLKLMLFTLRISNFLKLILKVSINFNDSKFIKVNA